MSLPVFIHPDLSAATAGDSLTLSGPEARHAVTVKRMQQGEKLVLIDGTGIRLILTVMETSGKDHLTGTVVSVTRSPAPNPRVTVVQAIPKSERAELAVDLATQAGADEIIAWQADRCVAKWDGKKAPKAVAKWQAAAEAAAKQSRRDRIPQVRGPLTTRQLLVELTERAESASVLVLHEEATESIREVDLRSEIFLLVGPEGGIGEEELTTLREAGAVPIKLGPEVVRTASAAMVALAAIGMRTERW
ncbi:16S rRNA (uracil(1498)-N(3))-methyltransferase [Corynebacterium macginleyi]|uniref:Ribosomal RNA small subunit methyltransferase E n=1 Tax=Corynebacterium macginleyi TaxID=38290 RepID=A0A3M0FUW4_9CORY|nr:16S rRNA (uracil(1498)-N(3))-methyltransferase [Corynebacterium macginleyi]MBK4140841.1 16S rRNA (uracil(1498)-N(3))-methyltransferase [Corynebacterium macginleyi]MBK4144964.1 16S rRNA (uracil(1498)-N(3))-methyltransferase [Corynebacterium macginleyi]MBK4156772.1 16S rRNA (uracil(1498)-N(3))-methyltransferase [Corynebacterium macginleyi]MBK4162244.1 16S rRNA (uracil(1498)-N(3))-methyltransferase [Corynebacterium macginleyi]MBK4164013.1 16S rRNA (uracil(1498)-N(3))-methyltransferase [Coryneb